MQYSYEKWDFVASYGNRGKWYKYQKQPGGVRDSQFYTAGVAYKFSDKLSSSFTYFYSFNRNSLNIYSLGVEYKGLPGIKTYAEVTYVQAKQKYNYAPTSSRSPTNAPTVGSKTNFRNSGTVLVIGIKLAL
jgi:lipopolysaccharide assembly outer membrane protein LptD (OstA)